jgi:hypothetical protein
MNIFDTLQKLMKDGKKGTLVKWSRSFKISGTREWKRKKEV